MVKHNADDSSRIVSLETRVQSIEDGIKSIVSKLDARSQTNWAPISILVSVLALTGGMGFSWINAGMSDIKAGQAAGQTSLKADIAKLEVRTDAYVSRPDLDARFANAAQQRDYILRNADARTERVERDVEAIQKTVVPRGEYDQTWAAQRERDAFLQRQLDEQRRAVGDLNTPRDTIQDLRKRMDDLERERRTR